MELSKCGRLRELDLKNTYVVSLPREMAAMANLLVLNLDGCPTKSSLTATYSTGMSTIHSDLRRKADRKMFKEQVFDHLTEWLYTSTPKEQVFEQVEAIFAELKDCDSEMLKKLIFHSQMLFPVKFSQIDPALIRKKLFQL